MLTVRSASSHTCILYTQLADSWVALEPPGSRECFLRCLLAACPSMRRHIYCYCNIKDSSLVHWKLIWWYARGSISYVHLYKRTSRDLIWLRTPSRFLLFCKSSNFRRPGAPPFFHQHLCSRFRCSPPSAVTKLVKVTTFSTWNAQAYLRRMVCICFSPLQRQLGSELLNMMNLILQSQTSRLFNGTLLSWTRWPVAPGSTDQTHYLHPCYLSLRWKYCLFISFLSARRRQFSAEKCCKGLMVCHFFNLIRVICTGWGLGSQFDE